MARKFIVGGNWKCNPASAKEANSLLKEWKKGLPNVDKSKVDVVICPPALWMSTLGQSIEGLGMEVCSQNVGKNDAGAFTGEWTAANLLDLGIKWTLIGHSERRTKYGETDADVAEKVGKCQDIGVNVILCIGETLEERAALRLGPGKHLEMGAAVNKRQLGAVIPKVKDPGGGTRLGQPADSMDHAFRQGQQIFQQQTGAAVPIDSQQLLQTYLVAAGQVPPAVPPRLPTHWVRFVQNKAPKVTASDMSPAEWSACPDHEWNGKTVDPRDKASTKVLQLETAMGAAIQCFQGASPGSQSQWLDGAMAMGTETDIALSSRPIEGLDLQRAPFVLEYLPASRRRCLCQCEHKAVQKLVEPRLKEVRQKLKSDLERWETAPWHPRIMTSMA
eukprot:Skav210402  [mRNA]  locus=scaffold1416:192783:217256:- [translate_table: standard]